jgi:hypothetical protein
MITESYAHIPFKRPTPDGQEFINVLMGKKHLSLVPLVEYTADNTAMRSVVEQLLKIAC